MKKLFRITFAVIADIATLGGAVNEGYFSNGKQTYTQKAWKNK